MPSPAAPHPAGAAVFSGAAFMSRRLAVLAILISAASLAACGVAPPAASSGRAAPAGGERAASVASAASSGSSGMPVDYFGRPCRYENVHVKPQPCLFPRRP
jgi:hypothetical protein